MGSQAHEAFACLFLNVKNEHLGYEIIFHGSIDRTHVHAREVLRRVLEYNAAEIIVCHNHSSSNAELSQTDITLTRSPSDLLAQVEMRLLDDIVVSTHSWCLAANARSTLVVHDKLGRKSVFLGRFGPVFLPCLAHFGINAPQIFWDSHYVQSMSGNRKASDGWKQRQPRDEQDPAPFLAKPPHPPFLGGSGKALCEIASVF